ncbi:MAG: hypothetical protein LC808_30960, partial [Actinobacteria bacterium]|nr:hypothetical protein [Actinomycetota bacterium]
GVRASTSIEGNEKRIADMTSVETYNPTLLRLDRQAEGGLCLGLERLYAAGECCRRASQSRAACNMTRSLLTAVEVAELVGDPTSWVY